MTKNKTVLKFALLSVALFIPTGAAISANIPAIAKDFPEIPEVFIDLLATIPSFFVIVSLLFTGFIEKYLGEKNTIMTGLLLFGLSGVTPVFFHDYFPLIFLSRCLLGIGIGMFNGLIIRLISNLYTNDQERANVLGMESAFEGLGGIILTFTVGQLLKINWYTSFSIYALAFPVCLFFALFVPNVKKDEARKKTDDRQSKEQPGNLKMATAFSLFLFVLVAIYINYNIKITGLITESGYGSATNGSNMQALVGVGAFSAGFLFGKVYGILKDYVLPLALLLMSGVFIWVSHTESILVATLCSLIVGFCFRNIIPYLFNKINQHSGAKQATTMMLIAFNIGGTLSPYESVILSAFFGSDSLNDLFFMNAIILAALSLTTLGIVQMMKNRNRIQA